jgi:hypothetical protein
VVHYVPATEEVNPEIVSDYCVYTMMHDNYTTRYRLNYCTTDVVEFIELIPVPIKTIELI